MASLRYSGRNTFKRIYGKNRDDCVILSGAHRIFQGLVFFGGMNNRSKHGRFPGLIFHNFLPGDPPREHLQFPIASTAFYSKHTANLHIQKEFRTRLPCHWDQLGHSDCPLPFSAMAPEP